MTFEEWYATQKHQLSNEQVCRVIWDAAAQAEREACAEVCETRVSAKQLIKEGVLSAYEAGMIVDANAFCASAIRMRSNVEVQPPAASGGSAGTES